MSEKPTTIWGRGLLDWATGHPTFGPFAVNLGNGIREIESEARAAALREVAEKVERLPILKISGEALSEIADTEGVAGAATLVVDWDEQEWFVTLSAVESILTEATGASE